MLHCWAAPGWEWRIYHSNRAKAFTCLCPWWIVSMSGTCTADTTWFRWTFTVQDECRLALAFWQAIFSYCLLLFILNLCFGMPVAKFHWILHLALNVFIKRTGCLAASALSILLLLSCWASFPFQVWETVGAGMGNLWALAVSHWRAAPARPGHFHSLCQGQSEPGLV